MRRGVEPAIRKGVRGCKKKLLTILFSLYFPRIGHLEHICICQKFFVILQPFWEIDQIMLTNTHILTIDEHLNEVKFLVRDMPNGEAVVELIKDSLDHLMELNRELGNANETNLDLQNRLQVLQRSLYEPVVSAQYTYPKEGVYNDVRAYVEQRKTQDPVFKQYCMNHNRKELCQRLSIEFGREVDPRSYGQNVRRN